MVRTRKTASFKQYNVEKILDKRCNGTTVEYLIKWEGYRNARNSWEPSSNCYCRKLIKEFEQKNKTKVHRKKRSTRAPASASSSNIKK